MDKAKYSIQIVFFTLISWTLIQWVACKSNFNSSKGSSNITAAQILGDSTYLAISFSGYRGNSRSIQPTVEELKEDLRLLSAMGIKLIRTYDVEFDHTKNTLRAIHELKSELKNFEMYVMMGAWIECEGAFTANPNHDIESPENESEIDRAVALANQYPDIVKVIAVGNEAMVKWAASYYVQPGVILKWVNYLQDLKDKGSLSEDLWITSSDNFASWGGGGGEYHVPALDSLIRVVDFISMHTYPMHDTHYNSEFWKTAISNAEGNDLEIVHYAMDKAQSYAQNQYESVTAYIKSIGIDKPIHIGETGWASSSDGFYGPGGSRACDEYKHALYYKSMRKWTNEKGLSCFFFEAFDEPWKDAGNPNGSENHFGLFKVDGTAKFSIWDQVEAGKFKGLRRGNNIIKASYQGNIDSLMKNTLWLSKD